MLQENCVTYFWINLETIINFAKWIQGKKAPVFLNEWMNENFINVSVYLAVVLLSLSCKR